MNYEVRGSGPALVLLHPVGVNLRFWDNEVRALASAGYRVIALDFRGHGQSERPQAQFSIDDLAGDVADVLTALETGPAVLVGLSLGGMVAQVLAATKPRLVAGLVLADTFSHAPPAAAGALEDRAQRALSHGMPALLEETLERWFTEAFRRFALGSVAEVAALLSACDPVVHAFTWRAIRNFDARALLPSIRVPTLVVVGDQDVSTPPAVAEALAGAVTGAEYLVIPRAGHISVREQPVYFLEHVDGFIRRRVFPPAGDGSQDAGRLDERANQIEE